MFWSRWVLARGGGCWQAARVACCRHGCNLKVLAHARRPAARAAPDGPRRPPPCRRSSGQMATRWPQQRPPASPMRTCWLRHNRTWPTCSSWLWMTAREPRGRGVRCTHVLGVPGALLRPTHACDLPRECRAACAMQWARRAAAVQAPAVQAPNPASPHPALHPARLAEWVLGCAKDGWLGKPSENWVDAVCALAPAPAAKPMPGLKAMLAPTFAPPPALLAPLTAAQRAGLRARLARAQRWRSNAEVRWRAGASLAEHSMPHRHNLCPGGRAAWAPCPGAAWGAGCHAPAMRCCPAPQLLARYHALHGWGVVAQHRVLTWTGQLEARDTLAGALRLLRRCAPAQLQQGTNCALTTASAARRKRPGAAAGEQRLDDEGLQAHRHSLWADAPPRALPGERPRRVAHLRSNCHGGQC